jgi:hypothetical protein
MQPHLRNFDGTGASVSIKLAFLQWNVNKTTFLDTKQLFIWKKSRDRCANQEDREIATREQATTKINLPDRSGAWLCDHGSRAAPDPAKALGRRTYKIRGPKKPLCNRNGTFRGIISYLR